MPEGPEIHYTADLLRSCMVNTSPVNLVWFYFSDLKKWESYLFGKIIKKIEAKGKALLIWFSNDLVLYTHNQLYGVWYIEKSGIIPNVMRSLRVRIENKDSAIFLYSASDIRVFCIQELNNYSFLRKMGPDILDNTVTLEKVMNRLIHEKFLKRKLYSILLDQSFISGIGNYLRVEILWESKLLPYHKVIHLTDMQRYMLCKSIINIPRLSYYRYLQKQNNLIFNLKVFNREGLKCMRCNEIILKKNISGRPFYFCAFCQK